MNAITAQVAVRSAVEHRRGQAAMACFIFTEAMLFVMLFFPYFYLAHGAAHWAAEPPKLRLPLVMLAVLLLSSVSLHWGDRRDQGKHAAASGALAATIVLGLAFLALQAIEYRQRLQEIRPDTDAYGSTFYLITVSAAMAGTMIAWRNWCASRPAARNPEPVANRTEFMAIGGVFIGAAFTVGILWAGLGSVLLTRCGAMR